MAPPSEKDESRTRLAHGPAPDVALPLAATCKDVQSQEAKAIDGDSLCMHSVLQQQLDTF